VFTGVFHTNKEAGTFRNKPLKQLKPQNSPFFVTTEHLPVRQTLVAAPKKQVAVNPSGAVSQHIFIVP
jgi:hypothetical protein